MSIWCINFHATVFVALRTNTHTSDDSECALMAKDGETRRDSVNVNRHARATSVCCICMVHYQYGRFFRVEVSEREKCNEIEQIDALRTRQRSKFT